MPIKWVSDNKGVSEERQAVNLMRSQIAKRMGIVRAVHEGQESNSWINLHNMTDDEIEELFNRLFH